jgi:hypothetical protein
MVNILQFMDFYIFFPLSLHPDERAKKKRNQFYGESLRLLFSVCEMEEICFQQKRKHLK